MKSLILLIAAFVFLLPTNPPCFSQEEQESKPIELEVLASYVGVWDAEVEVWSRGPDAPTYKFKGVETNRLYGKHWITSDFEFMDQRIHAIMGYDLDKKKMVGMIIDHGPYAANMIGDFDKDSETVHWMTKGKEIDGKPLLQKTSIRQINDDERILVLSVPGKKEGEFTKFMQIKLTKRKVLAD